MGIVEEYFSQLKTDRRRRRRAATVLTALSLFVVASVSWNLRMTGITLANDATCPQPEHQHTEECQQQRVLICGFDSEASAEELNTGPPEELDTGPPEEIDTGPPPDTGSSPPDETDAQSPPETEPEPDTQQEITPEVETEPEVKTESEVETETETETETEADPEAETEPVQQQPDAHVHTDECYQVIYQCGLEEHIHNVYCYSNPNADKEMLLDWQQMFKDYPYTGDLAQDLAGIAKTQVGYSESKLNYEITADGVRHGYTRYGDWYGAPYNDWSAMFVSFCLGYAKADTDQYPINSGADSMAALWQAQGRYTPAGEYTPTVGDLVFFDNNTVGIVSDVQNSTAYVICGDMDDSVQSCLITFTDPSVAGWGMTSLVLPTPDPEPAPPDPLDISNGPAVFIYEGGSSTTRMQRFSLKMTRSVTELIPYLETNGGSYFMTLLDLSNVELPKDSDGNYIAQANTDYKIALTFNSPEGFKPGTYQYQIPNGLMVNGGDGNFKLTDGTIVGSWVVTDTGLITLEFNDLMNSRTDITISAVLGIHFPEQNHPLDFDGKITVTVEKPPTQLYPTELYKWGTPGTSTGDMTQDPTKIYWTVQINGHQDSHIPGNILSDRTLSGEWSKDHHYTASDIAGGLTIGVSEPDPVTGEFKDWHSWHVSPDDPHLIWDENGWSYKMPETATCQWCGEVVLGNENWSYTVNYTSTPDPAGTAGTFGYENEASIDGQSAYAWTDFTHGEVLGEINKYGSFVSDAGGGAFLWEFSVTIPGMKEDQKADYYWYIMDYMNLLNADGYNVGRTNNDANLATVTATYKGSTFEVPCIQEATDSDMFAWDNAWTASADGIDYGQEFMLLCRCQCDEKNCQFWNGDCGEYWYDTGNGTYAQNGFCQCWTADESITFTFVYKTTDLSMIEQYGLLGYKLQNVAELYYKPIGSTLRAMVSDSQATVPIPNLFKKELTHDFDGYTAHYRVTVNESKIVLTDGSPLTIHDVMTSTLAYISGSLVITTEDASGNISTLRQGVDYTVSYDGSGDQTDELGNEVHVLDIVIQHPQPVMYILDYDTTLILPEQVTGGIKYNNSASITLWGDKITDPGIEKIHADINIAAKNYQVEIFKTCSLTNAPLVGATFGLYNEKGGLITTGVTDSDGKLLFQTNITEGIILREHVLYYLQELRPPTGYCLDDTQHWFCFCDKAGSYCEKCNTILKGTDAARIPFDQLGTTHIVNEPLHTELPSTGGTGTSIYILLGPVIILATFVYGFRLRRKYERRLRQ